MLNISLPPDLEEYVKAKVWSGDYLCVSEVVVDSLYLLQDRDTLHEIKLERLRKDLMIAVEQADRGEFARLDVEDIIAQGRKRLAEANLKNG